MKYESFFDTLYEPKRTSISIQQKEALEDLNQAYYLLRTSSASFNLQKSKIKAYIKYFHIRKILVNNTYIDSKKFLIHLLSLCSNIKDLHTELYANINEIDYYYSPTPRKTLYFSDNFFKKKRALFYFRYKRKK